jgi:hypothetical protein
LRLYYNLKKAFWEVPFVAGELKVVARQNGETVADTVRTAGEPALLVLEKHGIPEESVLNADEKRFAAKISEITGRTFDVFG